MDYFEQIVDSIDWTPELFLGICIVSAAILFLTGVCGWDYKLGIPKYKNPPPPPKKKCERCNGSGIWANLSIPLHIYQPCPPCSGTGHINPPKETGT